MGDKRCSLTLLTLVWCCLSMSSTEVEGAFSDYLPMRYLLGSRSDSSGATKSLFYDFFPSELGGQRPNYLEIRSLFNGWVEVVESAQFGISVNISGKSVFELASVEVEYTAVDDTILLQLKSEEAMSHGGLSSLITLAIASGAVMALVIIATCAYLCFWMVKFEQKEDKTAYSMSVDSFGSCLSYADIDSESLIKSWRDERWNEDDMEVKQTVIPTPAADDAATDRGVPPVGNGDVSRRIHLSGYGHDSSSENNTNRAASQKRQRYRAATQRSRDISSSDDVSSIDDNWTKRKASWRKGHAPRRAQFSDLDFTSGDAGFSSSNEFRPSRNRSRQRRHNADQDELEWDEYETREGTLPPPSAVLGGWQLSTDDERPQQDHLWPPPLDEPLLASDDSDRNVDGNLEDVRDAIHNAMDSVNSDMLTRDSLANQPESPHDDGYETGVAVNGPSSSSQGSRLPAPPPPVPPKSDSDGGGGGSQAGLSRLTMTVVMCLSLLSLVAGVYGVVSNLTQTHIVVFLPDNFFKEVNLFINDTKRIKFDVSRKPASTRTQIFDTTDPIVSNLQDNRCFGKTDCEHGCNRKTGACTCTEGYVAFENTKCTDKSDCLYLPCASMETCSNTVGWYKCTCADKYWRDATGTCVKCTETSCPPGTYETRGCPDRMCVPCSNGCRDGQHITADCTMKSDTRCSDCAAPCLEDEYEYRPCTNLTNRKCNKISEIGAAEGSDQLILESISNRRNAESEMRMMDIPHKGQKYTIGLVRGSGIRIEVSVKSVNLYPSLRPVVHSESNDNEEFLTSEGPPSILTTYCPHPMPVSYELLPVLHNNKTAAKQPNCPDCAVDPRKPCKTYKVFGKVAPLDPAGKSMVCSSPGALADMFNLNSYLTQSASVIVQPSAGCEALKSSCDSCAQGCANSIIDQRGTNCSITSEDSSNSWSPRLMYCQNCCLNRQCSDTCAAVQHCKPVSCWNGNVAEFMLSAKFPQRTMEFYCHVELHPNVMLISLDYTVLHNDKELGNFTITLFQDETTVKQTSYSDGLLMIHYTTGIQSIPDLIHGELSLNSMTPNYTSGSYNPHGEAAGRVEVSRLGIIPKRPFTFSTKWWKERNCSDTVLDNFLISDGLKMMMSQPDINVSRQDKYTYSLWNRTKQPRMSFQIPVGVSVIQKLYNTTLATKHLEAAVTRYGAGWRIVVTGRVETCPGYFKLKLWELSKKTPLADYEVAVRKLDAKKCHKRFSITFEIPGGDLGKIKRQFRIEVIDRNGKRNFIQAESGTTKKEGYKFKHPVKTADKPVPLSRSAILIMGPFLLVIGVTLILVSMAWIVSVVIPRDHGPVKSGPNGRATLFFFYAFFRVIYILATSFSIFAFIWYALNGADLVIVQNYMDAVDTVISQQQYDLRALVNFSTQTVSKQQKEFNSMRAKCFSNIESLQNESQRMMQQLSIDMNKELSTLKLKNELINALDGRARELKVKLETYRQNYNTFTRISSSKLVFEIGKTVEDFEKILWLSAARLIRGTVKNRAAPRPDSKNSFQRWLGIRTQLHSIPSNFMMNPLPIADIDNLSLPAVPPPPKYKTVDLRSVFLPTHDLYSEMKEPQVARADAKQRSYGTSLGSRLSVMTVLVLLLLIDVLTLTSRVAETLDTGQQILDGYVIEKTYKHTYQDGCSSEKYIADKITKKPQRVRYRLYKMMLSTNCVPLTVALLLILGMTFACLTVGLDFVSVETLTKVGLFSSLVGPWNLTSNIALDNIQLNMKRINDVEIPSTEATMNHYIQRIELLNNAYNNLSYYKWEIECGNSPSDRCGEFDKSKLITPPNIRDMDCTLRPISEVKPADMPTTITDERVKELMFPYLKTFIRVLESSGSLILTYTSYILIVKMMSVVLWNFLTRTAYVPGVRVRITNTLVKKEEKERQTETPRDFSTHMTFNRSTIEELSQEESLGDEDGEIGREDDPPFHNNSQQDLKPSEDLVPNGGNPTLS